jgi:hypothetical protein
MKTRLGIGCLLAVLALLAGFVVLPSFASDFYDDFEPYEHLRNNDFEGGFGDDGTGFAWEGFDNCGDEEGCTASFHDDTWDPVVYDGEHSQLIEINTFCRGASLPNRYAGIYQKVYVVRAPLPPPSPDKLCIYGMLRSRSGDPDPASWGYTVQVGLDHHGGTDWSALSEDDWYDVPWDTVYTKEAPGDEMDAFCMEVFTTSRSQVTIFIRLWKKWPTNNREVLLNLDGISYIGY